MATLTYPDVSGRKATYEGLVRTVGGIPPVGYWPNDEVNGTAARDLGSGGNNGTHLNTPTLGTQVAVPARVLGVARAASYTAASSECTHMGDVLDSVFAGANKQFTLATWVKPTTIAGQTAIMAKCTFAANERQIVIFNQDGKVRFDAYFALTAGNRWIWRTDNIVLANETVCHVAITYDGTQAETDRTVIYIDGAVPAQTMVSSAGAGGSIQDGPALFALAALVKSDASVTSPFNGAIWQASVFDSILTVQQIIAMHRCGRDGQ